MRRLMLALGAVTLLACGGDSTGPGRNVAGTWELTTVNGSGLPFTLFQVATPPYRLEILGDVITANENGTWTGTITLRENDNGTITTTSEPESGTWSQAGANVTITYSDGSAVSGTISDDRITLSESGLTIVYERQ
jgi:hypothetical protein